MGATSPLCMYMYSCACSIPVLCTLYVVRRGSERECGGEVGQRAVRVRGVEGWTTDPKAAGPSVDF